MIRLVSETWARVSSPQLWFRVPSRVRCRVHAGLPSARGRLREEPPTPALGCGSAWLIQSTVALYLGTNNNRLVYFVVMAPNCPSKQLDQLLKTGTEKQLVTSTFAAYTDHEQVKHSQSPQPRTQVCLSLAI